MDENTVEAKLRILLPEAQTQTEAKVTGSEARMDAKFQQLSQQIETLIHTTTRAKGVDVGDNNVASVQRTNNTGGLHLGGGNNKNNLGTDDNNGGRGSDSEASRLSEPGASLHGGCLGNPVGQIGGTENDDDDSEASGSDEEKELRANGQPTREACASTSSFHSHLDHKLSKEKVDKLEKKKWTYKWVVAMPNYKWRGTGECFLKELDSFLFHGLKPTLYKHWLGIYEKSGGANFDSSKQRLFFSICNSYRDILHYNKKPFYLKGLEEDSSTMDAYIMHSLNHIFRTWDLVKKNEAKLAKLEENVKADILNNEAFLDRGFTRPKVLILLPLASVAFRVVKRLIDLTPLKYKSNVEEYERFYGDFGDFGAGVRRQGG